MDRKQQFQNLVNLSWDRNNCKVASKLFKLCDENPNDSIPYEQRCNLLFKSIELDNFKLLKLSLKNFEIPTLSKFHAFYMSFNNSYLMYCKHIIKSAVDDVVGESDINTIGWIQWPNLETITHLNRFKKLKNTIQYLYEDAKKTKKRFVKEDTLFQAAKNLDLNVLKKTLGESNVSIQIVNNLGMSLLFFASIQKPSQEKLNFIKYIIENCFKNYHLSILDRLRNGSTLAHRLAMTDDVNGLAYLADINVNLFGKTNNNEAPLDYAINFNAKKAFDFLLKQYEFNTSHGSEHLDRFYKRAIKTQRYEFINKIMAIMDTDRYEHVEFGLDEVLRTNNKKLAVVLMQNLIKNKDFVQRFITENNVDIFDHYKNIYRVFQTLFKIVASSSIDRLFSQNFPTVIETEKFRIIGPIKYPIKIDGNVHDIHTFLFTSKQEKFLVSLYGDINNGVNIPTRVSSACNPGFILNSLLCDCRDQYKEALREMIQEGLGIYIYCMDQHGKNIGIEPHFLVYAEGQRRNIGLFNEIYEELGLQQDYRTYDCIVDILLHLTKQHNLQSVKFITSAPNKIEEFTRLFSKTNLKFSFLHSHIPVTQENKSEIAEKKRSGYDVAKEHPQLISKNPANHEILGNIVSSTYDEIQQSVLEAHNAQSNWQDTEVSERVHYLRKVFEEFHTKKEEFANMISKEMGKPKHESLAEMEDSYSFLEYYLDNAQKHLKDKVITEDKTELIVSKEPYGTAAVIVAWNFPFLNFIWACIVPLLAGNTVVFKHSEKCPLIGKEIENVMTQYLPTGVFQEVYGNAIVGDIMLRQKEINLICFTGSATTGKQIGKKAIVRGIHCELELGGSAPGILFADTNLDIAIPDIIKKRFENNGQVCDGLKRLIVHESIVDEVHQRLRNLLNEKSIGDPLQDDIDFGPLVDKLQLKKLEIQIENAKQEGANIFQYGKLVSIHKGNFFRPTFLTNVTKTMKVWHEEVFGPALPIMTFKTEQEAIDLANDTIFGLGGYVWTENIQLGKRIMNKIKAGNVCLNDAYYISPKVPFGGIKHSGYGRQHGKLGFEGVTNRKVYAL